MLPPFSLLNKAFQLLRANQEGDGIPWPLSIAAMVPTPILSSGDALRTAETWQFTV